MVKKSFALIALIMCALLIEQATAAAKKKQSSKVEESDSDASDTENDESSETESDEEDSDDENTNTKTRSKNLPKSVKGKSAINTKKSSTKNDDSKDQKNRFVLPNFKKTSVSGTGPFKHTWKTNSYKVKYQRGRKVGKILEWKKGSDEVVIMVTPKGGIAQSFKFGDGEISIAVTVDGKEVQDWKLGDSHYQVTKRAGWGTINNGSANMEIINKYKKLISSWCKANDFFVGKSNCVIY